MSGVSSMVGDCSPETGQAVVSCRSCGGTGLEMVLDLGRTPIANALLPPDADLSAEPRYPLAIGFCPSCALVQVMYELPAAVIFNADYPYYSSFSDELCRHAAAHVEGLVASRGLGSSSFVVEVASNDGYLLRNFRDEGIKVLGIDPSSARRRPPTPSACRPRWTSSASRPPGASVPSTGRPT